MTHLRIGELYGQTHDVRYAQHGEDTHQTVEESGETAETHQRAGVVASEEECGDKGHHYYDHRTLHIVAVADMGAFLGGGVGHEKERFEGFERRAQKAQLAAFGKGRLQIVYYFSQTHS